MQKNEQGQAEILPVAFFSKEDERRPSKTTQLEKRRCLGIVEVLKSFRSLLYGQTL